MKKLLIISLILGGLFLSGCSQQKGLSKSELFEKKQECAGYREQIEKQNEQYNSSWSDSNGEVRDISTIEELFYSPVVNSCIYTQIKEIYYNGENGEREANYRLLINDGLTNELIWTSKMFAGDVYDLRKIEFQQKIKELKGE